MPLLTLFCPRLLYCRESAAELTVMHFGLKLKGNLILGQGPLLEDGFNKADAETYAPDKCILTPGAEI